MPTYEYRCPAGHDFEVFQRMSDAPVASCPRCGADAERRISAGAGFLFKGEGFYITDYRSDDYRKKASSEKDGAGGGSGKAEGGGSGKAEGGGSGKVEGGGSGTSRGGGSGTARGGRGSGSGGKDGGGPPATKGPSADAD